MRHREEGGSGSSRERFRDNDAYRAAREWQRLEGTPQRELFRVLREDFLSRHPGRGPWVLDAGAGPGRFTARLGPPDARDRVALDIGRSVLEELRLHWPNGVGAPAVPQRVRGDAVDPPFAPGGFGTVGAMGNLLGFAGPDSRRALRRLAELVGPGGTLILEVAPGPGERSRYLHRLPPGAVARLLRSPLAVILSRVAREGFVALPARRATPRTFDRLDVASVEREVAAAGFVRREALAVAPGLGGEPERVARAAGDRTAWSRLLELEQALGRDPERWPRAAAVLLAFERGPRETLKRSLM
ncbi:MAG TPA: class I SAM-dependent methyltransferase [Thermoplasmata archaeon]|nr:class I SAM-dependent methyltransferase [Thermoplasmata archaeon]